jgi:hypothetical protein
MYRIIGGDKREYGPINADQLRDWIAQGRANGHTMIQTEGHSDWRPLASLPEFYAALNPVVPPLSSGPQAPGFQPSVTLTPGSPLSIPPIPATPRTNSMAVAGLVAGCLSIVGGWLCCCCVPVFSILGIIFSSIGLSQINKNSTIETGRGFAIAGLILSVAGVILHILLIIIFGMIGVMGPALEQMIGK